MHPKWTVKSLQKKECSKLKNAHMLRRWKEDVKRGGIFVDRWRYIETQTFKHFKEARECLEQV